MEALGRTVVDTGALYRMPWTMADNGFSWLEPTRECDMCCEYCYQRNLSGSAKPLEEVEHELEVLFRLRRADECDGCPNKTYWNGRLVSECRKEDYLLYGRPLTALPKPTGAAQWA